MRTLMQPGDIDRSLTRITHEILEANRGSANLVLLGIPTRGVTLARRIGQTMQRITGETGSLDDLVGQLDVTMYRDDLRRSTTRSPAPTVIPASGIDGRTVVLVDDVLFSGRSVRAALDALADIGRPEIVRLAVLVDRGHRELPIRPDYVGKNLPSAKDERVFVRLAEIDGEDSVSIAERETPMTESEVQK